MKKKLYWIDDSQDRQKLPTGAIKRALESKLNVTLYPDKPLTNRSEFIDLLAQMNKDDTVGVIMDYHLNDLGDRKNMAYGTTWAAEVRAAHASIPVIGTSYVDEAEIPKFRLESFLAFFPRKELTGIKPEIDCLSALLCGYHNTYQAYQNRGSKSGLTLLTDLLLPPKESTDLLLSAIPSKFRDKWDSETPHAVGRWIWHEFQGRPGFLFDELELATNLGLNINGFGKTAARFVEARYRGAFSSDQRPRWWVSEIRPTLEKLLGERIIGPISSSRDDLLKKLRIKLDDRTALLARAYPRKSLDTIPNCVAYRDDEVDYNNRVQALFDETHVDERDANPPFGFEARRIYGASVN